MLIQKLNGDQRKEIRDYKAFLLKIEEKVLFLMVSKICSVISLRVYVVAVKNKRTTK